MVQLDILLPDKITASPALLPVERHGRMGGKHTKGLSITACACCTSPYALPDAILTASLQPGKSQPPSTLSKLPYHAETPLLQCLASPSSTSSVFEMIFNILLGYIWLNNCGLDLRSKIMPERHTHGATNILFSQPKNLFGLTRSRVYVSDPYH